MPDQPADAVQLVTTAQCTTPGHYTTTDIPLTLTYHDTDPYAIALTFNHTTTWTLARSLFTEALTNGHAGIGDAQLARFCQRLFGIQLHSPDGRLYCFIPLTQVADFIASTYDVVPVGAEGDHLDLDDLIGRLLGPVVES